MEKQIFKYCKFNEKSYKNYGIKKYNIQYEMNGRSFFNLI